MLLAALRDDAYNALLTVHVIAALVAVAPSVIGLLAPGYFAGLGDRTAASAWAGLSMRVIRILTLPSLVILFLSGPFLVMMSDDVYEMSDPWISAAFLVWFAIAGVVSGMTLPAQRTVAAGDDSAAGRAQLGVQIAVALYLVMIYLMIFKPGA